MTIYNNHQVNISQTLKKKQPPIHSLKLDN
jgi:hypothetical protein